MSIDPEALLIIEVAPARMPSAMATAARLPATLPCCAGGVSAAPRNLRSGRHVATAPAATVVTTISAINRRSCVSSITRSSTVPATMPPNAAGTSFTRYERTTWRRKYTIATTSATISSGNTIATDARTGNAVAMMGATTVPNPGRPVLVIPTSRAPPSSDPHCSTVKESRARSFQRAPTACVAGENRGRIGPPQCCFCSERRCRTSTVRFA